MNPLYHLTVLPPPMPEAEALSQEIAALRETFGGDVNWLNPNRFSPLRLPRLLFGLHQLPRLRRIERRFALHQVYNPDPYPFPALAWLRRPVVYVITSGVGESVRLDGWRRRFFARLAAVVVPDERSEAWLRAAGLANVHRVPPGIDVSRFTHTPAPENGPFRLLMASAPWIQEQFRTKGIDALLEAAARDETIQLVFLWRGVLSDEMRRRVSGAGLDQRVTVLDGLQDVNAVLATVHAAVVLAERPGIVKSYPHSLLEALAAGKPVLVSTAIPMADTVARRGCGETVDVVTPEAVLTSLDRLRAEYARFQAATLRVGRQEFTLQGTLESYRALYTHVLSARGA